jgi:CubicO group peptidase (beta-lactamase class C family)
MKKLFYLTILSVFAPILQLHAQDKANLQAIDSMFSSLYKRGKFNGNVLLAEKGKVLYKKSFGLANEQTKAPLNENSIFELASCSKQFTAMAIALLQHKGKLSVDDDFTLYLPEMKHYKGITIKNLLYHTSGLTDYMGLSDSIWNSWDMKKIATNNDVIHLFVKYEPALDFETGTQHKYSNTGYLLLASIIERVSGKTYGAYLDQNIFKPLRMDHSFVYNRRYAPRKVNNYAFGYVMDDSLHKKVLPDSLERTNYVYTLDGIVGDGTVNTTVNDFLKWDVALYENRLLPAAEMKPLFESGKLKNDTNINYGFGWFIKPNTENGKIVFHSGGWPGYVTYIERNLTTHKTMIFLENSEEGSIPSKQVRLLMDGKPFPPPAKEILVSEAILNSYTGQYQLDTGFVLTITKEGKQLFAQATGQGRFAIYPSAENKFFTKEIEVSMEFIKEGEEVKKMMFYQGGTKIDAPKIH